MAYFASALWIFLELCYCFLFYSAFMRLKCSKKSFTLIYIAMFCLMILCSFLIPNNLIRQGISLLALFAISTYAFEGSIILHILLTVVNYAFVATVDTAVLYGSSLLLGISLSEFIWKKFFYVSVVTLGRLILILFAWLLQHYRKSKEHAHTHNAWILLMLLFPTISVIMLVVLFFTSQTSEDLSLSVVIFSIILTFANVAILYLISAIEKTTYREFEMNILKKKMELQSANIMSLETNYRVQRKATHEYEHHLQVLGELLSSNKLQEADQYIKQLQSTRELRVFSISSRHPIVDIVLNQKYQQAVESGINMQVQINDLSGIDIQSDKLVVLLSNLLDNAIEACIRVDKQKDIYCSIISNETLFISVRNTSIPVEVVDNTVVTSKSDKHNHGYGMAAIKMVLDELNADYTFEYSNGWFQFVADIEI